MRWETVLTAVAVLGASASSIDCAPRMTNLAIDDAPRDQWSRGVTLYMNNCAQCHGESGEGAEDVPSIAGDGGIARMPDDRVAVTVPPEDAEADEDENEDDEDDEEEAEPSARTMPLDNAQDLFTYVKKSMPPLDVGCLTDSQYYAVVHYVLKQADIEIPAEVNADNAASIKLR